MCGTPQVSRRTSTGLLNPACRIFPSVCANTARTRLSSEGELCPHPFHSNTNTARPQTLNLRHVVGYAVLLASRLQRHPESRLEAGLQARGPPHVLQFGLV